MTRHALTGPVTLTLAAALLLLGCDDMQSASPVGGSGKAAKPVFPKLIAQPDVVRELDYSIRWQTDLGLSGDEKIEYFEAVGDYLLVLESGNILTAIRSMDGRIMWREPVGKPEHRFHEPLRVEETAVITSETQAFMFDLIQGNVLRQFELANVASAKPVVAGKLLIIGSNNGRVFAHALTTGLRLWHYDIGTAVSTSPVLSGPTLVGTSDGGGVFAFNPINGAVLWRYQTYNRVSAQPEATEHYIYVASQDRSLRAIQRTNGRERWRVFEDVELTRGPKQVGDTLLLSVPGQGMRAMNPFTGSTEWLSEELEMAEPRMMRRELIMMQLGHEVLFVRPKDGRIVSRIALPKVDRVVPGGAKDADLYLVDEGGQIMRVSPRD